jgi:radical SAM superfamily enzyme YgiQ (UPF0313 family)
VNAFIPLGAVGERRGSTGGDVPYLLVNPPLTDPTTPYHSIPYLVGAARAAGYREYSCLDANLDALEYLAHPDRVGAAIERARRVRELIGGAAVTTHGDELRYRLALSAEGLAPTSVRGAIAVFRDPELFYHPPTYGQAVAAMYRWWDLLALDMPPGALDGFNLRTKSSLNLCSTADLADDSVIEAVCRPFEGYFADEFAAKLGARPWGLIGFSVNYTGQLPFALRMARLARRLCPDAVTVFGGTEVADVVKYTADRDAAWRIFRDADLIVPAEGESALIGILDAVRDRRDLEGIPGVMTKAASSIPRGTYENVAALPSPAYDVWEWERYWSPEPVILYSPTRGCYWNKCTFCDYGLNTDRPTSPSRERPADTVLADLGLAAEHGRVFYFAVDAMSPRYLRTLAARLTESPLDLKWGAELRLERTFPERSLGRVLADSGCVSVSFGYESGSQRILDLIDKGVKIDRVPDVLAELARNDIAAQMMGFTDFPTETCEEARETYEFLRRNEDLWTTAAIGVFSLTPGSIVAKQPDRFGVEVLPTADRDDIRRYLPWRVHGSVTEHWSEGPDPRIPQECLAVTARIRYDRPFVGGVDAAHSLLYYARYGRKLVPVTESGERPRRRLVDETAVSVPFASIDALTSPDDLYAQIARDTRNVSQTASAGFEQWLRQPGRAEAGASSVLVLARGRHIGLPAGMDVAADSALNRALRLILEARALV